MLVTVEEGLFHDDLQVGVPLEEIVDSRYAPAFFEGNAWQAASISTDSWSNRGPWI